MTVRKLVFCVALSGVGTALADRWVVQPGQDDRSGLPGSISSEAKEIKPGEAWPTDNKFRWLLGEITIPEAIGGKSTAGQTVALRFCCGDGGEVHVEGQLAARYDNDHPALVLLERRWGDTVHVQVQVFGKVQGGDKFDQAELVIVDAKRARDALELKIDAGRPGEPVPNGLIGLSQGGGLSDYEDKTAEKLKAAGFRWFRMDNVFTNVLKKGPGGELTYDWADFDKRLDFIVKKLRAEPIFAVSYMPQVLDAVENHDRQSAPRDYGIWEELCKRAAARAVERGTRVAYWEVWNEANSGWIKPGPEDSGADDIRELYEKALGKKADKEIIRRFEAYAKLYRASARGVLAGDPTAKVGGPARASGPF